MFTPMQKCVHMGVILSAAREWGYPEPGPLAPERGLRGAWQSTDPCCWSQGALGSPLPSLLFSFPIYEISSLVVLISSWVTEGSVPSPLKKLPVTPCTLLHATLAGGVRAPGSPQEVPDKASPSPWSCNTETPANILFCSKGGREGYSPITSLLPLLVPTPAPPLLAV